MKHKLTVTLAFAAGLLGGLLARYIDPQAALAQATQVPPTKEVRAQSFTIVGPLNNVVGTLTWQFPTNPGHGKSSSFEPPHIVLQDATGNVIWSGGDGVFRQLSAR